MRWGLAASVGVGFVLVALWIWNCTGPRPEVTSVRLLPPGAAGQPYRVEAEIANRWRGDGEVAVVVRLRDRATGRTLQADYKVQLDRYERALVVAELPAPLGEYLPEVEVSYPPR
jgi:hypothetical protein